MAGGAVLHASSLDCRQPCGRLREESLPSPGKITVRISSPASLPDSCHASYQGTRASFCKATNGVRATAGHRVQGTGVKGRSLGKPTRGEWLNSERPTKHRPARNAHHLQRATYHFTRPSRLPVETWQGLHCVHSLFSKVYHQGSFQHGPNSLQVQQKSHAKRQPAGRSVLNVTKAALTLRGPLISANDTWGVWAVLLVAAAGGFWSEKTDIGKRLSGPLVATLLGLLASNAGLIPCEAPAYSVVNRFLLPLAVPLLLFGADLRRVVRDTGRLLRAFFLGAGATVAGTLVALRLLPLRSLGEDGWKIAAALMSRHIGGAVNYVAVTEALQASASVVAAGLAADNLICALYFTSLFALAADIPPDPPSADSNGQSASPDATPQMEDSRGQIDILQSSTALALSAIICRTGVAIAQQLGIQGGGIPCITAVVVLLATLVPSWVGTLAPAGEGLAAILMQIFFATVGANGSIANVVQTAPALFVFSFVQIAVHLAIILGVGRIFKIDRKELLLASNANVGGPTTGAGMATAKGWRTLLVPTILVGIFGYAVATFLSVFLGYTILRKM